MVLIFGPNPGNIITSVAINYGPEWEAICMNIFLTICQTLNQSSPYDLSPYNVSANLIDLQTEPWEHHHLHCIAVICDRNGRRFA